MEPEGYVLAPAQLKMCVVFAVTGEVSSLVVFQRLVILQGAPKKLAVKLSNILVAQLKKSLHKIRMNNIIDAK